MTQAVVTLMTNAKRNEGMFASSVAIIGTMQAGFSGKNPKAIDAVIGEIAKERPDDRDIERSRGQRAGRRGRAALRLRRRRRVRGPPKPPGADCANGGGIVPGAPAIPGVKMAGVQQAAAMACDAIQGVQALKNGDVGGALKSASKLAPAPLGPALGAVSSFF